MSKGDIRVHRKVDFGGGKYILAGTYTIGTESQAKQGNDVVSKEDADTLLTYPSWATLIDVSPVVADKPAANKGKAD